MSRHEITVRPTQLAVTVPQAKAQLGYTGDDRDAEIEGLVQRATRHVEQMAGVQLMRATVRQYLDGFPTACGGLIELDLGPVASVESVTYTDNAGDTQTVAAANYQVDTVSFPARVAPAWGKSWPSARRQFNSTAIEYLAGVEERQDLPASAVQAILLLIDHWFCTGDPNRLSADVAGSLQALLLDLKGWPYA